MPKRKVSEALKKRVAGKQRFKCANKPHLQLVGLEDYSCKLWEVEGEHRGVFDESGYEIDHIVEHCISIDDSESNLQALCKLCHSVKTKKFMMSKRKPVKRTAAKVSQVSKMSEVSADSDKCIANSVELCNACEAGDIQSVVTLLSDANTDPAYNNNEALHIACFDGLTDVVELLLNHPKVDPSDKSNDSIKDACWNGHITIVKMLLADKRVDPSADDNAALNFACKGEHTNIVKLLLKDKRVVDMGLAYEASLYNGKIRELLTKAMKNKPNTSNVTAVRKKKRTKKREIEIEIVMDQPKGKTKVFEFAMPYF